MRLIPLREYPSKEPLFFQLWTDYLIEQRGEVNKEVFSKKFQEKRQNLNREFFLFEEDNEVIGFAEVLLEEECFPDEDLPEMCLKIELFSIVPSHRRHHLGQMALKLVRQWGREKKAALVEVEADGEEAKHFLKEQGLDLVGNGVHALYRGFI